MATTAAWLIAVGSVTGIGGVVLSPLLAPPLAVVVALSVWVIDGRLSSGRKRVPLAAWVLYVGLLVAASAWHVERRERPLVVELWLPTVAVLLVLAPIPIARSVTKE